MLVCFHSSLEYLKTELLFPYDLSLLCWLWSWVWCHATNSHCLILSEMKRKLWEVNHAQAAYRRLRPLSVLPMNWADLAGPDPQEDPLVESQENQESNDELNCRQVEDNDIDAVDDSGELKGTVPTDDYTDPQGTVPVDDDDAAELQKENDFSELEATAAHLRRATLVEGELRKFLENHWKDIQYWTDVIQSHMRTVWFEWA